MNAIHIYLDHVPKRSSGAVKKPVFGQVFSRFLPSAYSDNVNLAARKPWQFMPKYRDGDTVEFNIFRV